MKKICNFPAGFIFTKYDWFQHLPRYVLSSAQVVRSSISYRNKFRSVKDFECDLFNLQPGCSYTFVISCYLYQFDSLSPVHFSFVRFLGATKFKVRTNKDYSYTLFSM